MANEKCQMKYAKIKKNTSNESYKVKFVRPPLDNNKIKYIGKNMGLRLVVIRSVIMMHKDKADQG